LIAVSSLGEVRALAHVRSSTHTHEYKETTMSSGTVDKAKGRVKEAAGALTDDKELKAKGKLDQLAGKAKDAAEAAVDKVKDTVKGR
jgi:uncharacterized protein YjbJ (UPF0337 family)